MIQELRTLEVAQEALAEAKRVATFHAVEPGAAADMGPEELEQEAIKLRSITRPTSEKTPRGDSFNSVEVQSEIKAVETEIRVLETALETAPLKEKERMRPLIDTLQNMLKETIAKAASQNTAPALGGPSRGMDQTRAAQELLDAQTASGSLRGLQSTERRQKQEIRSMQQAEDAQDSMHIDSRVKFTVAANTTEEELRAQLREAKAEEVRNNANTNPSLTLDANITVFGGGYNALIQRTAREEGGGEGLG